MTKANTRIQLAHGGGGRLTDQLIKELILKHLPHQPTLLDAAIVDLPASRLAFTTDSYVVSPIFFPGGDLGSLAIFGTCNDLAMAGAKPSAISLALIIEEGLEIDLVERLLHSIAQAARSADVKIVTGDTKVVPRGQADQIYINTAGIGHVLPKAELAFDRIAPGDQLLLTGTIGDHGLAIMAQRENLEFDTPIVSDATCLAALANDLIDTLGGAVKFMRDPTRAGLAGVLVDIVDNAQCGVTIDEEQIPTNRATVAAAEMLGFDLLSVANEGKLLAIIDAPAVEDALTVCRRHEAAGRAAVIGRIGLDTEPERVVMTTRIGGRRIVQKPYGEDLPRIC